MATWVVHFRVGEYFLNRIPGLDKRQFALGNVAPDCGYGEKDSIGGFTPPPRVTHWSDTDSKLNINAERFYKAYLEGGTPKDDGRSFYLGYYVHLATDIRWTIEKYLPTTVKYAAEYKKDPEYLKVIKADWYDLDFKYLRDHPPLEIYSLLDGTVSVRDYFDYYEPGQLTKQLRFIADFYKKDIPADRLDREYTFMTEQEMDDFVTKTCHEIEKILRIKKII